MNHRTRSFLYSVCFLVIGSVSVFAQEGATRFQSGITVAIKTERMPPQNDNDLLNVYASSTSSGEITHRILSDSQHKIYFGYDVKAIRDPGSKMFRVSILPLSIAPAKLFKDKGFTAQAPRKYPEDVIISDGDIITFETLENRKTGIKLVDMIKVTTEEHKSSGYFAERNAPAGFTINDVHLRIDTPEIQINGQKTRVNASASGSVVWVYIHGKGRFIFSFMPQTTHNFQKLGIIEDNKIFFDFDGSSYRLTNGSPVLGSGGKWNLWVTLDTDYKPDFEVSPTNSFQLGSGSSVEGLFRKRD